jgi:hypothetical protein
VPHRPIATQAVQYRDVFCHLGRARGIPRMNSVGIPFSGPNRPSVLGICLVHGKEPAENGGPIYPGQQNEGDLGVTRSQEVSAPFLANLRKAQPAGLMSRGKLGAVTAGISPGGVYGLVLSSLSSVGARAGRTLPDQLGCV